MDRNLPRRHGDKDNRHGYDKAQLQDCPVCIHGFTTELHLRRHLLEHVLNCHRESEVQRGSSGLHINICNIQLPYRQLLLQSTLRTNRVPRKHPPRESRSTQKVQYESPPEDDWDEDWEPDTGYDDYESKSSEMPAKPQMPINTHAKQYQCAVCNVRFSDRHACKTHTQTHIVTSSAGVTIVTKPEATKTAPPLGLLTVAPSREVPGGFLFKQFRCGVCSGVFTDREACQTHIKTHLQKSTGPGGTRTTPSGLVSGGVSDKYFRCSVCEEAFSDEDACRTHIQKTHHQKSNSSSLTNAAPSGLNTKLLPSKQFRCSVCAMLFKDRESCVQHLATHAKPDTEQHKSVLSTAMQNSQHTVQHTAVQSSQHRVDHAPLVMKCEAQPTSVRQIKPSEEAPIVKASGFYCCAVCSAVFDDKHFYEQHTQTHNVNPTTSLQNQGPARNSQISSMKASTPLPHRVPQQNSQSEDNLAVIKSQELYRCSVCKKIFNDKISCEKHMGSHTLRPPAESKPKSSLLRDILAPTSDPVKISTQTPLKLYRCDSCKEMFKDMAACAKHAATHHLKLIKCMLCDKGCTSKADLVLHNETVHPQVKFMKQEVEDGKQCAGLGEMDQQGSVGIPDVVPFDTIKMTPTDGQSQMRMHDEKSGEEFDDSEIITDVVDVNKKRAAMSHLQVVYAQVEGESHQCNLCTKMLKSKVALAFHIDSNHACPDCGQRFKNQVLISKHQRAAHAHTCELCGTTFDTSKRLARHMKRCHKGTEWPPKCKVCGKVYDKERKLAKHMVTHTKDFPCVCEVCGFGFPIASRLARHMLTHQEEKKYKCEQCGRGFNENNSLKAHKWIHTGEKPYICHRCGKAFRDRGTLTGHLKRISCTRRKNWTGATERKESEAKPPPVGDTPQQVFPCEICLDAFTSQRALTRHQKTCTPSEPEQD